MLCCWQPLESVKALQQEVSEEIVDHLRTLLHLQELVSNIAISEKVPGTTGALASPVSSVVSWRRKGRSQKDERIWAPSRIIYTSITSMCCFSLLIDGGNCPCSHLGQINQT